MALGHLRIDPLEWPRWTLREFDLAYEGWAQVNINDRWEQVRALSFYSMICHVKKGTLNKWEDVFKLASDSIKKKSKTKANAIIRKMTENEKKEFQEITKTFNG